MDKLRLLLTGPLSYSRIRCFKTLQRSISCASTHRYKWEPDEVEVKQEIPDYPPINLKLQGYDFPVLESFTDYIEKSANRVNIDTESWAMPPQKLNVKSMKPATKKPLEEIDINIYERIVQLKQVSTIELPLFLELLWTNTPVGVTLTVKEATDEDEEARYVPDHMKQRLHQKIEELMERKKR